MKVYFTASVSSGRAYLLQYKIIIKALKSLGHKVLSEDVAFDSVNKNGDRLKRDSTLPPAEIFLRERREVEESDIVIAEVSQSSMGVGFLISHALQQRKPVLALLYGDIEEKNISPFLEGHPSQNLFLEHYTEDNLKIVLKKFFHHMEVNNKRKGKLVVVDGSDSSGKKTQVDLLLQYLQSKKYKTKYIDFPRYYSSFHGRTVARYLKGEFGGLNEVNPYLSSLAYALDRSAAKEDLDAWLLEDNIVIANRYVSSSMAFQTVRLPEKEREIFLKWLYEMEYKEHKLPIEDIVIYLYVPVSISQKLMENREKKKYLKGKDKDIHEKNVEYLKDVENMYLELVKRNKKWVKINCIDKKGNLRSKEDIHREVISLLKKKMIFK
ncbi:MAG: Tmk: thymidylate kinase [candidate division CPR3 bacterium GW2011_GWF2_35_18]|uniref:Thymidylate kinase n=1 Tax=candidate division CPR3 bacterium GW2011_GWF2_35_18 TaxID=1618350 RepID=A0A0G0BJ60_UNCC3|nr:MAG: Tmk: thymidylate kinase [candidate division CPR3 bacterium GW2011_GWF2_35_18]